MSRQAVFGNGTRDFNLDETNTTTVQKSAKVLGSQRTNTGFKDVKRRTRDVNNYLLHS